MTNPETMAPINGKQKVNGAGRGAGRGRDTEEALGGEGPGPKIIKLDQGQAPVVHPKEKLSFFARENRFKNKMIPVSF